MGVSTWVSSLVEGVIKNAKFNHSDFMGNDQSVVSVDDIVFSMMFYAFKTGRPGRDTQWDDECYQDFNRREKTFDRLLKKVENFSTKDGNKKISSVKKEIRSTVESREISTKAPLDTLGVFVDTPEMGDILFSSTPKEMVESLHLLGNFPEDDPRYYVHTIFRYQMNELHHVLCENKKVMRFPSIQRWMDISIPVGCIMNLPPEFRSFMKQIGGSHLPVVSLPVPSKEKKNSVVYGYTFETVPWVQIMRQEIFRIFSEWKNSASTTFLDVYPEHLILGNPKNKVITEAIAKSTEMRNLKQTYESLKGVDMKTFSDIIVIFPEVVNIFCLYKNKSFEAPGEQLRERRGFFMHSLVRGVFKKIPKKFPGFCNDVYSTLSISCETIDEFYTYCSSKNMRRFTTDDHELWRTFLFAMERICLVFHTVSRVTEVEEFYSKYGTPDAFVKEMFSRDV